MTLADNFKDFWYQKATCRKSNVWVEFDQISRHFVFGDHFLHTHHDFYVLSCGNIEEKS